MYRSSGNAGTKRVKLEDIELTYTYLPDSWRIGAAPVKTEQSKRDTTSGTESTTNPLDK